MIVPISVKDKLLVTEFSVAVVKSGQNGQNYYSSNVRSFERKVADTYRGKIVEVALCIASDTPKSVIDWTVGKGCYGATTDNGIDLVINGYKISVNGIAPNCHYLLIPTYKVKAHEQNDIDFLVLGTSLPKPAKNIWTKDILRQAIHECNSVLIDGWVSLADFKQKSKLFESGGSFRLDTDNHGVHKNMLSQNWFWLKGDN